MSDKSEIKVTRTYSLSPAVIAWVTQKAARLTIEGDGERASDSKIVNDLLTAAMEQDKRDEAGKKNYSKKFASIKKSATAQMATEH